MGIVKSAAYLLEAPDDNEPLGNWAAIQRRQTALLDTLLRQRAVATPAAQDLAAVAGRVSTLEAASAAPVAVPFVDVAGATTGWSNYGTWQNFRAWREGSTVFTTGLIKPAAAVPITTQVKVARIPAGLRPPVQEMIPAFYQGGFLGRVDIGSDGLVQFIQYAQTTMAAGNYVTMALHWSIR